MKILYISLIVLLNTSLQAMDVAAATVSSSSSSGTVLASKIKIVSRDGKYSNDLPQIVVDQLLTLRDLKEDLKDRDSYTLPAAVSGEDFATLEPFVTALAENKSITMDAVPFKQLCSLAQTADHLNVPAVYHTAFSKLVQQCATFETMQHNGVVNNSDYQKLSGPLQARIAQQIVTQNSVLYPLFFRAYATSTANKLQASCEFKGTPNTCCFTSDGQQVACVNDKTIELKNPDTGTVQATLTGGGAIKRLVPAHTLPLLAAIAGKKIHVWNTKDIKRVALKGHIDDVDVCDFCPDDTKLASVSVKERIIKIWDVSNRACFATIPFASPSPPTFVGLPTVLPSYYHPMIKFFSHNRLAVSEPNQVSIYDLSNNLLLGKCCTLGSPDSYAVSPQGTHIVAGTNVDTEFDLYDCSSNTSTQLDTHADPKVFQTQRFNPHAFSSDGSKFVTKKEYKVQVYDVSTKKLLFEVPQSASLVFFVPGMDVLCTCNKASIAFWNGSNGSCYTRLNNTGYSPYVKVGPIWFPSINLDQSKQKCLMQTWFEKMSVFPVVDAAHFNNLNIEKLVALLYTAQPLKEGKSSMQLPKRAIEQSFHTLPAELKTEILQDILKNRTWTEWFGLFFDGLGQ